MEYQNACIIFTELYLNLTNGKELDGKQIKNIRFANMLEHIGTNIISTMNPRTKGKIKHLRRAFQDCLYKELKRKISQLLKKQIKLSKIYKTNISSWRKDYIQWYHINLCTMH